MPALFEWPCDSPGCQSKLCAQTAICDLCYQVLCPEHDVAPAHACRTPHTTEQRRNAQDNAQRQYLGRVLSDVATHKKDLINDAQRLRPEHTCHLILPENSEQLFQQCRGAGFNVHFTLKWDDDIKWLIRVRQGRGHRIPLEVREADINSEVATLQRLRAGGISVPEAWLPGYLDGCNDGMPTISPFPFDYFYTLLQGRPWPIRKTPFYPMRLPEEGIKNTSTG